MNPSAPSDAGSSERARVVNTEGQGANMRAEPSPGGTLVRTVIEGTELELIGAEREGGGRLWRNVRDPASGASGWIASELLSPIAPAPAAEAKPAGEPKPSLEPKPAGEPKPTAEPKPVGSPKPAASPPAAGVPDGAAKPATRIGEADRAYLTVLQAQVDALGTAITSANEQIERAGGRPEMVSDPTWRQDTEAVIEALDDAAAKIRAASPGPATGAVHRYASNAADRAEEAGDGLSVAIESRDAGALNGVRTTLVRLLAELNNMNLTLLELQ
jgi:Bacterial SH3 domain